MQSLFSYLPDAINGAVLPYTLASQFGIANLVSRFLRLERCISVDYTYVGAQLRRAAIKAIFIRDLPAICDSRSNGNFKGSRVNILRVFKNGDRNIISVF